MEVDENLFYNNENSNIIDTSCYSLFNNNKEYKYDGKVNIWVNKKNLSIFPKDKDQLNAINILKSRPGYCIVSRSKLYKYVPLEHCISINGKKIMIDDLFSYDIGDIILSKLPGWKSFLPCTIKSFHDINDDKNKHFGSATLSLMFVSCPESDLTIAWNYSRNIVPNKSVISHIDTENNIQNINNYEKKSYYDSAPFAASLLNLHETINENVIISRNPSYIPSGLIDKVEENPDKQLLKYNLSWIKPSVQCFDNKNIFGKKAVTVASTCFSNNFTRDFLPNVRILEPEQFNKIFKIQQHYVGLTHVIPIPKNNYNIEFQKNNCNIEPQTIEQFKVIKNAAAYYLERNNYVTFTGYLCENAKKYLFNI